MNEIDQLNAQAEAIVLASPQEAEQLARRASALAQSSSFADTPYQRGMVESDAALCRCYTQYADYQQALMYGQRAIANCEHLWLPHVLAATYGRVGYAHMRLGQYVDSFRAYLRQEELALQYGYRDMEAGGYLGRAGVYVFIQDLPKATTLMKRALALFREIANMRGVSLACNNLGFTYNESEQYQQALQYSLEALDVSEQNQIDDVMTLAYTNIGRAYIGLKAFDEGKHHLEKALTFGETINYAFAKLLVHRELGRLAQIQDEPTLAIAYLQLTLQEATEQDQKHYQYEAHYALSELYLQRNDTTTALAHFRTFHHLRDELLNLQNKARLGVLEVEHAVETARREVERSKQLACELEQQVHSRTAELKVAFLRERELTQQLEKALAREVELQQLKSNIIHTASHEFRTPLAIIGLAAEILEWHYERLTPERRRYHWNRVKEQILYLTDMLQDIFTVNSATDVVPYYTHYRFVDFCQQQQAALVEAIQPAHLLHITFPTSTQPLSTDFALVKRILFNLTVNAIKFSDGATPVVITFAYTAHHLLITIADQGIGIPPDELDLIFDLFYRASNVDTRRGIGLGLSVVQKLVQVLQGTVQAESPGLNQGSTFTVLIPLLPMS